MDKEIIDYKMYEEFVNDYKLNEMGGIQLLRILLNRLLDKENENDKKVNDRFLINYKEYYQEKTRSKNYDERQRTN